MSEQVPPSKLEVARALLVRGSVFVYLDPRVDGVFVPRHLAQGAKLVLQIGLDLVVPIPDLRVDEDGIRATLSFNRTPFLCQVPWDAVFALHDDDGASMVWPEDLPAEVAAEIQRVASKAQPKRRNHLRAVDGGAASGQAPTADAPADERRAEAPPVLRVAEPAPAVASEPAPVADAPTEEEPVSEAPPKAPSHLRLIK